MTLIVPIGPIVWILVRIFRGLRGQSAPQTQGYVPPVKGRPISIAQILIYFLVYLPLSLTVAIFAGDATADGWGWPVAFGLTLLFLCRGPYWLAWRVLGPFGFPVLGRVALRLATSFRLETLQGHQELFSAAYGGAPPKPERWAGNPWSFFVVALRRKSDGNRDGIDQVLELLKGRHTQRLPRRLLSQGVELLAWPALRDGDWEEARRRLVHGRGRGVRLLRRLGAAHAETPAAKQPSPLWLWLAWLLAPERRRTLCMVRAALARQQAGEASFAEERAAGESVWRRHLALLARAAAGRAVSAGEVEALAVDWDAVLGPSSHLRLLTRAAELGAPDAQAAAAALRPAIEAELASLAEAVEGDWPEPEAAGGLVARMRRGRQDRLFAAIQAEVEPFLRHSFASFPRRLDTPLAEMERWLQLRLSLRKLLASEAGALSTVWYNGFRLAACNWPVYVLQAHGREAYWACREMSVWCEDLAREMGDQEIVNLSHRNSRIGLQRFSWR